MQLVCQMGGANGPSFLPQGRPTERQELKMDVWVRALLMDKLGYNQPLAGGQTCMSLFVVQVVRAGQGGATEGTASDLLLQTDGGRSGAPGHTPACRSAILGLACLLCHAHVLVPMFVLLDADLSQYTVSREVLLKDGRVSEIAADPTAQFLLQAGYEHVARSMDAASLEAMT